MSDPTLLPLAGWENFYVIIGSSAGTLTGLQFVVIALAAEARRIGGEPEVNAFATPTVVHFCAVLLISALLSAPWGTLRGPVIALAMCGAAGVVYALIVVRRARGRMRYQPVLEDWIWHAVLPLIAYAALLVAAITLASHATPSLFVIAASTLLLLFIGIHNAWDTVTYIAIEHMKARNSEGA